MLVLRQQGQPLGPHDPDLKFAPFLHSIPFTIDASSFRGKMVRGVLLAFVWVSNISLESLAASAYSIAKVNRDAWKQALAGGLVG
jgi:hypothetical protein